MHLQDEVRVSLTFRRQAEHSLSLTKEKGSALSRNQLPPAR